MRILIVEDASSFAKTMVDILALSQHTVSVAIDVSRAEGFLSHDKFDCLIVDLNMRTTGLRDIFTEKTCGGLGTGWMWLKEQVFNISEYAHYKNKTIICSAYINEFKDKLPEEYKCIIEANIPIIHRVDAAELLIKEVERLAKYINK